LSRVILIGGAAPPAARQKLAGLGEDAFLMRVQDGRVILAGASPRATLYAVYAFLETLGVGFPRPGQSYLLQQVETPGPMEETVPARRTLDLAPLDRLEKPSFSYRATMAFPMIKDRTVREIDWMAKNRLNWIHLVTNTDRSIWDKEQVRTALLPELKKRGIHVQGIGHSFFAYIPPEQYQATHPEYFAMDAGGKRQVQDGRGGLCVSNPDLPKVMAENMGRFLDRNPEIEIIDLWTNDSAVWCFCPECKRMQGVAADATGYTSSTRSYLRFVNQVAGRLAATHPGVRVNALAYALNFMPDPETRPAANVLIGLAPWQRVTYRSSDDYYEPITKPARVNAQVYAGIKGWLALTPSFYLYDYCGVRSEYYPIIDTLRKDYAHYKSMKIDMVSTETFLWPEFNIWAYARLAWDHKIPLDQLIDSFCRIAYRAAAPPMAEFHTSLERYKWEWIKHRPELEALLIRAKQQAGDDPTVVAKLDRLVKILAIDPFVNWDHQNPPPPLGD